MITSRDPVKKLVSLRSCRGSLDVDPHGVDPHAVNGEPCEPTPVNYQAVIPMVLNEIIS